MNRRVIKNLSWLYLILIVMNIIIMPQDLILLIEMKNYLGVIAYLLGIFLETIIIMLGYMGLKKLFLKLKDYYILKLH